MTATVRMLQVLFLFLIAVHATRTGDGKYQVHTVYMEFQILVVDPIIICNIPGVLVPHESKTTVLFLS